MATATLLCKQCNFENEPERVYCHNCGAKLDRSLLPPEATRREDPVIVQERVRKIVSPRRAMGFSQVKNLLYSVIIASCLAALLLIIKPPSGAPELSKDAVMGAIEINENVEGLVSQAESRRLTYTEDQVNAFLQRSIRGKETTSVGISLKFERAFVRFQPGRCSITSEQSVMGLPIYATTTRSVEIRNGALVSRVLGGSFGCLHIPALAMPYLEGVFSPLWKVLDKDRALVAQLQSITFQEKSVSMINKPAGAR